MFVCSVLAVHETTVLLYVHQLLMLSAETMTYLKKKCFPLITFYFHRYLIDNIFIDNRRSYSIKPCLNGLSDHDGQILTLLNLPIPCNSIKYTYTRRFDNNTIADFQLQLSYEQWDNVFGNNNVNEIFNNFLNTY